MSSNEFEDVLRSLADAREVVLASGESWSEGQIEQMMDLANSLHNALFERLPTLEEDAEGVDAGGTTILAMVTILANDPQVNVDSVSQWLQQAVTIDPVIESCVAEFLVEEVEPEGGVDSR